MLVAYLTPSSLAAPNDDDDDNHIVYESWTHRPFPRRRSFRSALSSSSPSSLSSDGNDFLLLGEPHMRCMFGDFTCVAEEARAYILALYINDQSVKKSYEGHNADEIIEARHRHSLYTVDADVPLNAFQRSFLNFHFQKSLEIIFVGTKNPKHITNRFVRQINRRLRKMKTSRGKSIKNEEIVKEKINEFRSLLTNAGELNAGAKVLFTWNTDNSLTISVQDRFVGKIDNCAPLAFALFHMYIGEHCVSPNARASMEKGWNDYLKTIVKHS